MFQHTPACVIRMHQPGPAFCSFVLVHAHMPRLPGALGVHQPKLIQCCSVFGVGLSKAIREAPTQACMVFFCFCMSPSAGALLVLLENTNLGPPGALLLPCAPTCLGLLSALWMEDSRVSTKGSESGVTHTSPPPTIAETIYEKPDCFP